MLAPELLSVFEAAAPAFGPVTFVGAFVWLSAEPAADIAALLELLLLRTLDAAEAALFPVTSFLATF